MKLDQAIEILENDVSPPELRFTTDYCIAVKLGIEAIRWIRTNRYSNYPHHIPPLASETID